MDTSTLKSFAQEARRYLLDIVSKKVEFYLTTDSIEIRAKQREINELKEEIAKTSKERVIEQVAYTWFNRFCALRFMDVNQYTPIGIISPLGEETQPEILKEAKTGHIKTEFGNETSRARIIDLLSGKIASPDSQAEAYRGLLVLACNYYNSTMPFLFERIDHYTELLLPDDLLSENSILSSVRKAITQDNCKDIEIIGWLYQFYISEKKDEVINRRSVVSIEEIPAATQLFTPKWIVKYVVENSLGRLWMLNRPTSKIIGKMEYYIKPELEETDFLKIKSIEEIKICDPACGSGHMLVYAFELLYAIYEEEGFSASEIPSKILLNNLFGIEIDERAGELAAFALTMKAREKHRRYFSSIIQPKICVLENIHFEEREIKEYMDHVGHDLFSLPLQNTLRQFEEAKNFGSLIRPEVTDVEAVKAELEKKKVAEQLFLSVTNEKVLKVLEQTSYLSPKYHVVIANPPYMGTKGMNLKLKEFAKTNYPKTKSDLFAMFIERNISLAMSNGELGFVTPFVWMFIASYIELREHIFQESVITNLVQLEYNAFEPACIPVCVFTLSKYQEEKYRGAFIRLSDFKGCENQSPKTLEAISNPKCGWFYHASASDFKKIPGSPIAYWVETKIREAFNGIPIGNRLTFKQGMATSDNERFLKYWFEVSIGRIDFQCKTPEELQCSKKKWFPYNKGGSFRKWYGNNDYIVNWENDGKEMREFTATLPQGTFVRLKSRDYYCLPCISYSALSSGDFGCRISPSGYLFDTKGSCIFGTEEELNTFAGLLNSIVAKNFLKILCPTLDYSMVGVKQIPIPENIRFENENLVKKAVAITKSDWDTSELSWDYKSFCFVGSSSAAKKNLGELWPIIRHNWDKNTKNLQVLEEENNSNVIKIYGLQDGIVKDVLIKDVTLTCNPYYRYGGDKTEEELTTLLLTDTMKEFISYAVGCMFGRYSLDKEGLILANQGDTVKDYLSQVPSPTFAPDEDNVIPILDNDWFTDDISSLFIKFLKTTFGETNFNENLKFIEDALGKDIRKYFAKDFYNDHIKMYKKRPIYWMFSSPKGTFNALIYMHRYTPDTVSIVLNNYLREFRTKLLGKKENLERLSISGDASSRDKTSALKEIEQLKKMILELDEYEKDILYPLATQKIAINLDDGVKVNYLKFGKALKPIKGLDKDEEG